MTVPTESRFSGSGLAAVLAGVVGVVLLVSAAVRFVGLLTEPSGDPAAFLTTAPTRAVTTVVVTTSSTKISTTIDPEAFVVVSDDSGLLSVSVPVVWGDVSGAGWMADGRKVGPAVTTAPDVDAWYTGWGTPGAFVGVSSTGFEPEIGDFSEICTLGKTDHWSVGVLSGTVTSWSRCGDERSDFYVFMGGPPDASFNVLIQLVATDGTGLEILEQIMATLRYDL